MLDSKMTYDPEQHHRRSIRLPDYDYRLAGFYYVTLVIKHRQCLLGKVVEGEMQLNSLGCIVDEDWRALAQHHDYVELDEYMIMPNHFHGILRIVDEQCRGGSRTALTTPIAKRKPLGRLIGVFKTRSTKRINQHRQTPAQKRWQRNYYEHIICNEDGLNFIRYYIQHNPENWDIDDLYPTTND